MTQQQQIKLKIQKIHNWPLDNQPIQLDLQFYSKQSEYLITRKHISASTYANQLLIGISLKIRYPLDQNIIIIAVKQTNDPKYDFGEVEIDLEGIREGGTKYVPIGGFEKIMQFEVEGKHEHSQNGKGKRTENGQKGISLQERRVRNTQFIQERKKFIKIYNQKQKQLQMEFQQKITSILTQKPKVFHQKQRRRYQKQEQQFLDPSEQAHSQIKNPNSKNKLSQDKILTTKSAIHQHQQTPSNTHTHTERQGLYPQIKAMASPKKHKLILNTLNIVSDQNGP